MALRSHHFNFRLVPLTRHGIQVKFTLRLTSVQYNGWDSQATRTFLFNEETVILDVARMKNWCGTAQRENGTTCIFSEVPFL